MPANNPKDVFVTLMSEARNNTERTAQLYHELSQTAQNPDVQETLEAQAFVTEKNLEALDRCFEIIGERPQPTSGRMHDVFVEDLERELTEIPSPPAKHLFILAKATQLAYLRYAEYITLVTAAEVTGHTVVGVLLESTLADKAAFQERTQCLIQNIIDGKMAAGMVA